MLLWLKANLATIIISVILVITVALVIRKMIKDKRQGKSSCGCGCANCALKGQCHPTQNNK
ncbi:MAG: FeoB-associated Cys-rich membrane protein [Acutalibacteraceae bacterium]